MRSGLQPAAILSNEDSYHNRFAPPVDARAELELGRRIDHVFVRCSANGPTMDIRACKRLFDEPVDGVWATDHFGVVADLSAQTPGGRPVR